MQLLESCIFQLEAIQSSHNCCGLEEAKRLEAFGMLRLIGLVMCRTIAHVSHFAHGRTHFELSEMPVFMLRS
jgi:hypothetical protein